jgi:hypothetical protein
LIQLKGVLKAVASTVDNHDFATHVKLADNIKEMLAEIVMGTPVCLCNNS